MRPKKPGRCFSSAARGAWGSRSVEFEDEVAEDAVLFLRKNWLRVGVQVRARKSETRSATVMVMARARKKEPVTPAMEISGRKTTMGVIVEPRSGMKSS